MNKLFKFLLFAGLIFNKINCMITTPITDQISLRYHPETYQFTTYTLINLNLINISSAREAIDRINGQRPAGL